MAERLPVNYKFDGSADPKLRFSFKATGANGYAETFIATNNKVVVKGTSGHSFIVGDNAGNEYFNVTGTSGDVEMGKKLEMGKNKKMKKTLVLTSAGREMRACMGLCF